MADDTQGSINNSSEGGISGKHDSPPVFEFIVAPSLDDKFNTARLRLLPIACWRVDDIRFAFDSSFVDADISTDPDNPPSDIRDELKQLASLLQAHPGCPLSVFGHADPVGDDEYNKLLSGRRASAIYALLIFNTDPSTAVKMWNHISSQENWGSKQREVMQNLTGTSAGTQDSALIKAYLQKLCPPELKLAKTDFLAQGADSAGRGDFQGCGEFNPVLLFSQEDQSAFDQAARGDKKKQENQDLLTQRNAANSPNRRVMVLFFRKGSKVVPAKWPCPSAVEGTAKCRKRFWSDSEDRRSTHSPGVERKFTETHDTFACRFYQRISDQSPCEQLVPLVPLRIRLIDDRFIDQKDQPFDGLTYKLEVLNFHFNGVATGALVEHLIPATATTGTLTLLTKSKDGKPAVFWKLNLQIVPALGNIASAEGAQARLNNLGFFASQGVTGALDERTVRAIQRFQTFYKIKDASGKQEFLGDMDEPTIAKLKEVYGV
jgi:outer membrane protein OmpA-like peptidoglycan-associated protein